MATFGVDTLGGLTEKLKQLIDDTISSKVTPENNDNVQTLSPSLSESKSTQALSSLE